MPYVNAARRLMLNKQGIEGCEKPGELNYLITQMLTRYFHRTGGANYQAINDILGALEGAKLEFYRRVAVPYEQMKMEENGDVYP